MNRCIKYVSGMIGVVFSLHAFATDSIRVTVTAMDEKAAAIGFSVDGKACGGPGKSYSGKGPKNKDYSFGYRERHVKGPDVSCGSLTLTENAKVVLVTEGGHCQSTVVPR